MKLHALRPALPPSAALLLAIGDFDGDGFDDLMGTGLDEATDQPFVQLRYGGPRAAPRTGTVPFATGGARLFLPEEYATSVPYLQAVGDLDGDGYADILMNDPR